MAGGAQQRATPSQGGQSGQMGQGGFGNQVSSLLQNPNLPSMLQNVDTSSISPQNQQAIQQAYQNAQHPMMSAQPQFSAQPQMTPQMMAAAQRMQSQPGQIDASGQLQPQQFNAAIGMATPSGNVVGPGQQGFQMPQGGSPNMSMANPMAMQQAAPPAMNMANPMAMPQNPGTPLRAQMANYGSPNMSGLTFDSTPYAGGGSSFSMASSPTQNTQAIGRVLPNGSVVGPGQPGFDMPPSGAQGSSPNMGGLTFNSTPYAGGGSSFSMASSPASPVSNIGGPDVSGTALGGNQGFDFSGSDGGQGGQPVSQRQSPMGGRPAMLSDFRQKQGLQVQGNPTAQGVQRGIGALGRRMR